MERPRIMAEEAGPGTEAEWDRLIDECANGVLYQKSAFLAHYAHKAERVVRLLFRSGGRSLGLLAGGIVPSAGRRELAAPFSASFGGISHTPGLSLGEAVALVDELIRAAGRYGVQSIRLAQPPSIYSTETDDRLDFALLHAGFTPATADLTLYLSGGNRTTRSSVVRNVKRAENNGLEFRETDDAAAVWDLLHRWKESRKLPLSVSRGDLAALKAAFPDHIRAFLTLSGNRPIGAMVLYQLNRRTALAFAWDEDEDYRSSRPNDFMLTRVINVALTGGTACLDLGTVTLQGEPVWGVTRFKENFGPRGALRKTYVLVLPKA